MKTNFFLSKNSLTAFNDEIDVLCVHGLCCSKENFIPLINAFKKKKINASSIDLPGFGSNSNLKSSINSKTFDNFFKMLKMTNNFSTKLVIILHSVSSCFINEISKHLKYNFIILLEGNIIKEDTKWSELISNMSDSKFDIYVKYLKSNYLKILTNSMIKKYEEIIIENYFSNGKEFNDKMLKFLAKLGLTRTNNGTISNFIKKNNDKIFYVCGSREIMRNSINFCKQNSIQYFKIKNCGHYPMIEAPNYVLTLTKKLIKR